MNILLTGATGLIGKEVGKVLAQKGHRLFVVSRNEKKAKETVPFPCEVIVGDLSKTTLEDARMRQVDVVINLMGESVVGERWTEEVKQRIYDSRVIGTRNLIASLDRNITKVFVSGSAIGFYGDCAETVCSETASAGSDFLAKVTMDWEAEALRAPGRVCLIRTGIVLSTQGGALEKMLFPFKAGVGGALSDGRQWMSWIHINDIVNLFVFGVENDQMVGAINGAAPNPVTNKDFSLALADSVGRKLAFPVPKAAIYSMYGESAETILSSARCNSEKVLASGFQFEFSDVKVALEMICTPFKDGEELFYAEQFVPLPPEELFSFFKDPYNLEELTPASLKFNVESVSTKEVEQGTLIDYTLKIHGVPAKWRTLIDEWNPPFKFVDTSLRGPYRLWHHTHEFRPFCGGTLMVDRVRYRLPLGYLGWLIGGSFVRKDVEGIFSYRRQVIADRCLS